MFWITVAAQLTASAAANTATSASEVPTIEVNVEQLPPGLTSPALVKVKFRVGPDGRPSSCEVEETGDLAGERFPALRKIACAQIEQGYRVAPARKNRGKLFPSTGSAIVRFSTDHPVQSPREPSRQRPPYRGGPLDGIYVGEVMRPDNGVRFMGLKPSKPNASPVPAKDEPAIRALIEAFKKRDPSNLNGFVTKDAKQQSCPHGFYSVCGAKEPLAVVKVAEDCTFNTPYYLGDHTVRLEWLYRGELWYWSEVYLTDGRIRLVRTHPADKP